MNQWPIVQGGEQFKNSLLSCFDACSQTSSLILKLIALSLDLQPHIFDALHNQKDHILEIKHYPKLRKPKTDDIFSVARAYRKKYEPNNSMENDDKDNDGKLIRVKTHADLSSITILFQNEIDGLQVLGKDGKWIDAVHVPNAVLINSGIRSPFS